MAAGLEMSFLALRAPLKWSAVLHTEGSSSLVFKSLARTQAAIYDFLIMRYAVYPLKLLELLLDPHSLEPTVEAQIAALQLLSAKPCALDSFSDMIRRKYPSVNSLLGESCQRKLRLALQTVVGTTFKVETLHSVNLRRLKSRSMTHGLAVSDVALTHVGTNTSEIASIFLQKAQRERPKQECKVDEKSMATQQSTKGGGGGAWRAFLHIEASKEALKRPFQRQTGLAGRYAALTAGERAHLKAVGKAATAQHRQGHASFPQTARAAMETLRRSVPIPEWGGLDASLPSTLAASSTGLTLRSSLPRDNSQSVGDFGLGAAAPCSKHSSQKPKVLYTIDNKDEMLLER